MFGYNRRKMERRRKEIQGEIDICDIRKQIIALAEDGKESAQASLDHLKVSEAMWAVIKAHNCELRRINKIGILGARRRAKHPLIPAYAAIKQRW